MCVDVAYTSIERVIRALVSLPFSDTASVKHLCAAALCNLSDLKSVRAHMVHQRAHHALPRRRDQHPQSLRCDSACSVRVSVAYALSSGQDPIIQRCIGLTLSRLAMERTNCQKIIHESGVAALGSIAVKYPTIPGISQPVASAFQLLSSNQSFEGSVTVIASLKVRWTCSRCSAVCWRYATCCATARTTCPSSSRASQILTLISMCDPYSDLVKDFCSLAF